MIQLPTEKSASYMDSLGRGNAPEPRDWWPDSPLCLRAPFWDVFISRCHKLKDISGLADYGKERGWAGEGSREPVKHLIEEDEDP